MSTELPGRDLSTKQGHLSIAERLALVWDQKHFFPDSTEELRSILAIGHYAFKAGKTSALLSHVFRRQSNLAKKQKEDNLASGDYDAEVTIDPIASVRSMLTTWTGYALLSKVKAEEVKLLQEKITSEYTPQTSVADVKKGLRIYTPGLQVVSDFACLDEAVQNFYRGQELPANKRRVEDFYQGTAHLNAFTMADLRPTTQRTIDSLMVRREFWRSVLLEDCYKYYNTARPIIDPYLEQLTTD